MNSSTPPQGPATAKDVAPPTPSTPPSNELSASSTTDELHAALLQRDALIAKLKNRAKQFVAQMRGQLTAEQVKTKQMEALAAERKRLIDSQAEEIACFKQAAQKASSLSANEAKSDADKYASLQAELDELRDAYEQSTKLIAVANAKSREKQDHLDKARASERKALEQLEAAEVELEEARASAKEAKHEVQVMANQAELQQGASQQVLKDTRSMVTELEKERDILSSRLNDLRVQTKDSSLKLEEDLRVARNGLVAMREDMQKQKTSFAEKRELAKAKFLELVTRAETAEGALEVMKTSAEESKRVFTKKETEMGARIAHLEGVVNVLKNERDSALESNGVCARSDAELDKEKLLTSLAKTEAELKEQRQKRLVAKNEILSMVRQLDENRDTMSTLFSQLQQLVTKTGTIVIECRGMESKCDDALIALDVDVDMNVELEISREGPDGIANGAHNYGDSGSQGNENSVSSQLELDSHSQKFGGVSVELTGFSSMKKTKRSDHSKGRGQPHSKMKLSAESHRRSQRSPADVAAVLEDEFEVFSGIFDEVQRKVEVLTKYIKDELGATPQGVQRRMSTLHEDSGAIGLKGGLSGNDGCVGYLKRLLGSDGSRGVNSGLVASPQGKRMAVGVSRSDRLGNKRRKNKGHRKRGGYGELHSEGS